jgi:hypothetical protein
MRMNNPFSDEPGDEEQPEEDAEARDAEVTEADADDETAGEQHDSPTAETDSDDEAGSDDDPGSDDGSNSDDEVGSDDDSDLGPHQQRAGVTAPSIGPDTVIERKPPEERLDFDKISDEDAMGKDKRREVVGKTYGPTRTRVIGTFAAFLAVVAALAFGFYLLAQELDQPPAENPDEAPWSQAEAPQQPPKELQ